MNWIGFFFVLLAHYLCGRGVLHWFGKIGNSKILLFFLSFICGVASLSFVPLFVQLIGLSITSINVGIAIVIFTITLWLPNVKKLKLPIFSLPKLPKIYEYPFIIVILLLLVVSIWRCYYYPPLPRDLITGPELIAEYAVKEHILINSVFSIDLSTTNNCFKSPYITGLQIIYKLFVCPFGQIWLSVLVVCFTAILYLLVRRQLHPILAGFVLISFITIPEIFAYSYLVLYDYSNMVFFTLGLYFLINYVKSGVVHNFLLSTFLLGLATYIRSETIVLIILLLPILGVYFRKMKMPILVSTSKILVFCLIPFLFYALCNLLFVRLFVPIHFRLSEQLNNKISLFADFIERLKEINKQLIFSQLGITIFAYYIYFFLGVLLIDIFKFSRFTKEAIICFYSIAIVYFGLALLGCFIPLIDILNTTKRGYFKFIPLMVLYMRSSVSLKWLSAQIYKWEIRENKIKKNADI